MIKFTIRKAALFLFTAVIFMGIGACKKDSPAPTPLSKTELLTKAAWKMIKKESKTNSGAWIDYTSSYAACEKDDNFIFYTNASYELNEGLTKCSPADPQIYETGTWSFINNETEVKTISTVTSPAYIRSILNQLDQNSLIITSSDTSGTDIFYQRGTYGH